ncbi:major facilitator superfamily domain-containing protein [Chaetomium sp. MPI-SDFR-AT-0129]|uniref:Major facilitator superfamily domain-containing protein n=1 Tax=Dichotomopilus funicola TaxID=1934379 RepID=A0AAN6UUV3_9PEZI|nr:major facilitator superfamily domain-containing protein [Chaetomium sp. MPI-SDFR-AT-0129]KAK4139652.1 major facilitator superfamily domain-containing protein [Dichotomopilus funicola]
MSTTSDKNSTKERVDVNEASSVAEVSGELDSAWKYLDAHRDADAGEAIDMAALRRRIDWRIVPLMFLCYTLQFLDKVILNYGAVMGLNKDLNLQGNDFSNLATYLFVGLLLFEIPNTYFLQIFPAAKWLGINVTLWGVATACGAAAHNYQTLLVSRVFLGIFEATIAPSLMLISSHWYTKSEQAPRFCFWYTGLGIGQIIGGLVSYGFQNMSPDAQLSGWRTMFVVLGVITVLTGASVIFFLPDTPMKASWMSDSEKRALLRHVSVNQTGIENRKFRAKEIFEALVDPQIYLLLVSVVLLSVSSGVVTTYSATLIRGLMDNDPKKAALMNTPSGAISIFFTLFVGFGIRLQSHRWAFILACIVPAIIGGGLMSFLPSTNKAGCLAGIYLVNAVVAPLAIFYNWIMANVGGATKRAFAAAIISGSFSLGNIIGPQTFQAKDAPEFRPAKIAVMATQAACAVTTFLLFLYYVWQNKRRTSEGEQEDAYMSPEAWSNMTDRENKKFRYAY